MAELKLDNCTLTILPANPCLKDKLRLKAKRKFFEWQCPECGAKNSIEVKSLPYEFSGGDHWSQVINSSKYLKQLDEICKSKSSLISFLAEKAKIEKKILGETSKLRLSASARVRERCSKCGAEVNFNIELSIDKSLLEKVESCTLHELEGEVMPEDDESILDKLFRGYNIYTLMKKSSLTIDANNLGKIRVNEESLKNLKDLLKQIELLKNDLEKTEIFNKIEAEIERLMEEFETDEALIYVSDMLSSLKKLKKTLTGKLRRGLFISLALLEDQIGNLAFN